MPAQKLFLLYRTAWWGALGMTRGRATTDLPLRQLWYGGTCPPPGPARDDGPALLLAAYPSGPATKTWEAAREPGTDPTDPGRDLVGWTQRLLARGAQPGDRLCVFDWLLVVGKPDSGHLAPLVRGVVLTLRAG